MKKKYWEYGIVKLLLSYIQRFHYEKYFSMRKKVIDPNYHIFVLKLYYLYKIKRMDAFNNASLGTNLNSGASFKSYPNLPHGINGIILGHDVKFGHNCTIHQQVTVQQGSQIEIGNNVFIGAGAKILKGSKIGDNVKIGANCVVFQEIPQGATVVLQKPRIIEK